MLQTRLRLFLVALFASVFVAWSGSAHALLRVAYPEYRPYFYADESGRMHGFFYEIITEAVSRRLGVPLSWECYPWSRCQVLVKNARADAMITVPTLERLNYSVTHEVPFYSKSLTVFTYRGHPRMKELQNLGSVAAIKKAGFTVVTYAGNGWNKDHVESLGIPTNSTTTIGSVWSMLAAKRGDLAIEWPPSAWPDIIGHDLSSHIVQTEAVVSSMPFHLLIRKDCAERSVLLHFDETIRAMRRDGTMLRILQSYGLPDRGVEYGDED